MVLRVPVASPRRTITLAAVMSGAIDLSRVSCELSPTMRHLIAVLGLLAMLVTLSGPVAALAATPCHDAAMAKMAMTDDMAPCKAAAKVCAEPCFATTNCQSQCWSTASLARVDPDDHILPLFAMKLRVAKSEHPPGATSPVDGPPPRL